MREPLFPGHLDLPVGEYQAEVAKVIDARSEEIVLFRLTEPADKEHPQAGLGGRIARAWFQTKECNEATKREAEAKRAELLRVCGAMDLDAAIGSLLRIRLARVVMRSDPSRYKVAAVEFLPLVDHSVKKYVEKK